MKIKTPMSVLLACLTAVPCWAYTLPAFVNGQVPNLVETYKGIHSHPERSHSRACAPVIFNRILSQRCEQALPQ